MHPHAAQEKQPDSLQLQVLFGSTRGEIAEDILAACEAGLQGSATVTSSRIHPYPDIPGHHQAILDLQPHRDTHQVLEMLLALGGGTWRHYGAGSNRRAIWQRSGASRFLHPEVCWACLHFTTGLQ